MKRVPLEPALSNVLQIKKLYRLRFTRGLGTNWPIRNYTFNAG